MLTLCIDHDKYLYSMLEDFLRLSCLQRFPSEIVILPCLSQVYNHNILLKHLCCKKRCLRKQDSLHQGEYLCHLSLASPAVQRPQVDLQIAGIPKG